MPDPELTLESLGWSPARQEAFASFRQQGLEPGRVAVEDKHYYTLLTASGELTSQIAGKLMHTVVGPAELPKVGDWVALAPVPNEAKAVIHHVLARTTKLSRKVAGRDMEEQILATNMDTVFVVQAIDSSFNLPLLHRHLIMVFEGGARPAVVLNKADLCDDVPARITQAKQAAGGAPVVVVSGKTQEGVEDLARLIAPGTTVAFMGSSGVGKSTLINDLYGEEIQATAEVRASDAKGRHTTTWRELIVLPNGGLVIDTPGMREFQMWAANEGFREAFADLEELASHCRFRDCTHTVEKLCAIQAAVETGQLPRERYERFLKLKRELAFLHDAQMKHSWIRRRRQGRAAQSAFNKRKRPHTGH